MSDNQIHNTNLDVEYVNMPQNDLRQIEQIAREYEGEPAKGLAHGVQKDAIQNGVGARIRGREPATYRNWIFTFKLFKINGKYALSFWDEGTTGLTGSVLSDDEIEQWSMEDRLTAEQNLSRFLTRFESGGNYGPGLFGRGKLIFQAASKTSTIICDSLRYDDNKYIAFDRKIEGTRLRQPRIPLQGEQARKFIIERSSDTLEPLTVPGTRITILDLKNEIVKSIKNSFKESNQVATDDYSGSFIKMIEETWWEILEKFDAKIYVEFEDNKKRVELSDPLKSIIRTSGDERGWKVYKKTNVPIVVNERSYRIKELKFILSPQPLEEDLRSFWVQRKRMKIGNIPNFVPHHTIHKKLCGYVALESELEGLVLLSENPTHYSFNWGRRGLRQIKQVVFSHLGIFQEELGIRTTSDARRAQQDMLDVMRDINNNASELGLISDFSTGSTRKDVEISIESFQLPNENSKCVEINQEVGPIIFKIKNNTVNRQPLKIFLIGKQRGCDERVIHTKQIDLQHNETKMITFDPFIFDEDDFIYGEGVYILAKVTNRNSGSELCKISRIIWLGMEEPEIEQEPFVVTTYQPLFPHSRTRRVEITESIRNIRFKISNNTAYTVNINVDLLARKAPSPSGDVQVLKELIQERNLSLPAMSEKEFAVENLFISIETFGIINEGPASSDERKCEIFFSSRLAENVEDLNMIKGTNIGKKKIEFYIGIDPPGRSIFKKNSEWDENTDGRRSRYLGDRVAGYEFRLNVGHPSFKLANEFGDEARHEYIREQMLRQAYAIAVQEKEFSGIAEEFEDRLDDPAITPAEAYLLIDEIVGKAIIRIGG